MDPFPSKCLLCLVKVEREPLKTINVIENVENEESSFPLLFLIDSKDWPVNNTYLVNVTNITASTLKRQLDIIFLLKKVLQLSPSQLRGFLKVRGNPEDWFVLCGGCEELLKNVKEVFVELQRISKKYEEERMKVEETIRVTSLLNDDETDTDIILGEVRETVCKRRKETVEEKRSLKGGSKAQNQQLPQDNGQRRGQVENESETDREEEEGIIVDLNDLDKTPTQTSGFPKGFKSLVSSSPNEIQHDPLSTGDPVADRESISSSSIITFKSSPSSTPSSSDFEEDTDDEDEADNKCDEDSRSEKEPEAENSANTTIPQQLDTPYLRKRKQTFSNLRSETIPVKKKQLNRKSNLTRTRKYECSLCRPKDKYYKKVTFDSLLWHVHRVHQVSYKCTQCDHGFKSLDPKRITNHYREKHKNLTHKIPMDARTEELSSPGLPEIPWWCPTCSAQFLDEKLRDNHIQTDHGNFSKLGRNFKCDHCPKTYFSEDELNAHILLIHPIFFGKSEFQCDQCFENFKTGKALRSHRIQLHNLDLHKCQQCEAEYTRERYLADHIVLKHGDPEEKAKLKKMSCRFCRRCFTDEEKYTLHKEKCCSPEQLICHVCQKPFKSRDTFKMHLLRAHGIVGMKGRPPKTFTCTEDGCRKIFYGRNQFQQHTEMHKKLTCTTCWKEFKSQVSLDKHELIVHKIVKPSTKNLEVFDCPKCEARFLRKTFFEVHSLTCTETRKVEAEGPLYTCTICTDQGKTFQMPSQLEYHLAKMHDIGVENYFCFLCNTFFTSKAKRQRHVCGDNPKILCDICGSSMFKNHLQKHIATVHESRQDVACDLCEFRTTKIYQLRRHQANKHGIGIKCQKEDCTRFFCTKKDMQRHLKRIHPEGERERSFLCSECGRGFYNEQRLRIHLKVMHLNRDSKPYKCKVCGKGFAASNYRSGHMKIHRK